MERNVQAVTSNQGVTTLVISTASCCAMFQNLPSLIPLVKLPLANAIYMLGTPLAALPSRSPLPLSNPKVLQLLLTPASKELNSHN